MLKTSLCIPQLANPFLRILLFLILIPKRLQTPSLPAFPPPPPSTRASLLPSSLVTHSLLADANDMPQLLIQTRYSATNVDGSCLDLSPAHKGGRGGARCNEIRVHILKVFEASLILCLKACRSCSGISMGGFMSLVVVREGFYTPKSPVSLVCGLKKVFVAMQPSEHQNEDHPPLVSLWQSSIT